MYFIMQWVYIIFFEKKYTLLKICGKTDSSFETKQQQYCIDSIKDACLAV